MNVLFWLVGQKQTDWLQNQAQYHLVTYLIVVLWSVWWIWRRISPQMGCQSFYLYFRGKFIVANPPTSLLLEGKWREIVTLQHTNHLVARFRLWGNSLRMNHIWVWWSGVHVALDRVALPGSCCTSAEYQMRWTKEDVTISFMQKKKQTCRSFMCCLVWFLFCLDDVFSLFIYSSSFKDVRGKTSYVIHVPQQVWQIRNSVTV